MTSPPPRRRGQWIPWLSVNRPVTVGVALMGLLVLGAIAYQRIPLQLVPSGYDPPFLYVGIPTLPSTPSDVEDQIAIPAEEMLSTVRHVREMRTRISAESVTFRINFDDGTDMAEAYNEVRDRLERVLPSLPEDVERYWIWKYDPNDSAIYWFGVTLLEEGEEIERHRERLTTHLLRPLERVNGVSRVEMWGATPEIISIKINEDLARSAGETTGSIIRTLQRENFIISGGQLEKPQHRVIRVDGRFDSLEGLRALEIGRGYRLGDVAEVDLEYEDTQEINRINGREGVVFAVYKESLANTVDVCAEIKATLDQVIGEDPELKEFEVHHFHDQGVLIIESVENLQEAGLYGALFAVLILLISLRKLGMTLVITIAIPLSLLITLVVMTFTGFTLNLLTLMGLMLSVGMVIDNSIVVVENIERWRVEGHTPGSAALHGAAEVTLALVVATSTTVIVFLPMILMSGNASLSFYLGKIGYPVCISLLASLLVSLLFVPIGTVFVQKLPLLGDKGGGDARKPGKALLRLEAAYRSALSWTLRHRANAAAIFALIGLSTYLPMQEVAQSDELEGQLNDLVLRFHLPPSMTLDERDEYFSEIEANLNAVRDTHQIDSFLTQVKRYRGRHRVRIFFSMGGEQEVSPRDTLIDALPDLIPESPGVSYKVGWSRSKRSGDADASVTLHLVGPDTSTLVALSEEVVRRLEVLDEVLSVEADLDEDTVDEIHLDIEREQAARHGLTSLVIGGTVDYSLRGRRLSEMTINGRDLEVKAIGDPTLSERLERLMLVEVTPLGANEGAPLEKVTQASVERGLGSIRRDNGETRLGIKLNTNSEDLKALNDALDQALADLSLPQGYHLDRGERHRRMQMEDEERTFALSLAVVFVFLLMGVLFESIALPLVIVASIPFAFLGVYWMLYLTNTTLDIMAGVGLIILVGVVVNNGIVLVDTIRQRANTPGVAPREAILSGASRRLRPVLMTALTTIFGLVPMAAGDAGLIGIPYAPLGRTVIGGLVASTLLTLFVVPYLYSVIQDLKGALRALIKVSR